MKNLFLNFLLLILFVGTAFDTAAQNKKTNTSRKTVDKNPSSFTITKAELERVFALKVKEVVTNPNNKYIDKAQVLMNTKNGDILFLKAKLSYFPKSSLLVQVNGVYTTQVFIMSEDKSIFYKGKQDKDKFILSKCSEDEIVSE